MRAYGSAALAALITAAAAGTRADDPPAPTRAEYRLAADKLKQIGIGFHTCAAVNADKFPGDITDKDGKPLLSWRVAVLPFVEELELYKQFKLDEPWDSEHNKKLVPKMPKPYVPVRVKTKEGETFYQRFAGPRTLLDPKKQFTLATITDGTSNTALVLEAGEAVVWSKPADLPFDAKKPLPKLGAPFNGQCHVLLCDGAVIRLKRDPDEKELKKLIMPDDGEVIDFDKLTK